MVSVKSIKRDMRKFWGAISSFQQQVNTINGTLDEVRILMAEVTCDIRSMDEDLKAIKEELIRLK